MALYWTTLDLIPRLGSYAAAAAYEANILPIRGDEYGTKPLDKRNCKYRCIRKMDNGDIWIGWMWAVFADKRERLDPDQWFPWIAYHPDDTITIYAPLDASAQEVVNRLLSEHARPKFQTMQFHTWLTTVSGIFQLSRAVHRFKLGKEAGLIPVASIQPAWEYRVNRKGKRAVLRRNAEFISYARGMAKMLEYTLPSGEEYVRVFGWRDNDKNIPLTPASSKLPARISHEYYSWMFKDRPFKDFSARAKRALEGSNQSERHAVFLYIMHDACAGRYLWSQPQAYKVAEKEFEKSLVGLMCALYPDECYTLSPVEKVRYNRHRKYADAAR